MRLLIKDGLVVDPTQQLKEKLDLLAEDGRIRDLGTRLEASADLVIQAEGLTVVPGLIDLHVHLREPGREDVETIETGSQAAAAGGFTSICCMPNTQPINDCAAVTAFILARARAVSPVNIWPIGAITRGSLGKELADYAEMKTAGIAGLSDDGRPVSDAQLMRRAIQCARQLSLPVVDHCQDDRLFATGVMHEGSVSARLGLAGIPALAEEVQIARDIMLAEESGGRVHIAHLSTAGGVRLVREGKARGVNISCEVTPHHLLLNDESVDGFDANFKMNPPLRSPSDVSALLEGLLDGTIDAIATDHAPHHTDEKLAEFDRAPFGVIGLETAVPLLLDRLVAKEILDISTLVRLMSTAPASIVGQDRGSLKVGSVADITVLDPQRKVSIDAKKFRSKARNTPFDGWTLQGCVSHTIVAGKIVFSTEQPS